jgi:pyridoxamine 5'-phosphate oxidase
MAPSDLSPMDSSTAPREWTGGFSDPMDRFRDLYKRAQLTEPFDHTAVILATANADGMPSARVVLLKAADEKGFLIVTNYESRKGRELTENPYASLCFYYPTLNEQCRVEGIVSRASAEESDAYFASRPRTSQLGAWASSQSRPLDQRETLMDTVARLENEYEGKPIPRPDHWGGFRLTPLAIEFWMDGAFRLHDRFRYHRAQPGDSLWTVARLYP